MKMLIVRLMGLYLNALAYVAPLRAGHRGFNLFCHPFRVPFNQKQKEFFNTADRSSFKSGDVDIQVYRWGRGPKKIVFLHGWQSHTYRWKAYIEALSKDEYSIYSLDAPGHGASGGSFLSVPVYAEVIQKFLLELGDVHTVIGHSLGSFSLLYTFHQHPLLPVQKIILMAPPGEANDFMDFFAATLRLSARTMKHIHNHFENTYQVKADYFSTAKFAASVKVNGLIIHDEEDTEAPFKYAQVIQEAWKRSKLITTKGLGHNLKSASVVNIVVNYIDDSDSLPVQDQQSLVGSMQK